MLHPCNATYGSSSQSIGHRIGAFASTSLFISLNSPEFVSRWITGTPVEETEPVLTLERWMLLWSSFQLLVTVYLILFVPEVDPELQAVLDKSEGGDTSKTARIKKHKKKRGKGKNKKARK